MDNKIEKNFEKTIKFQASDTDPTKFKKVIEKPITIVVEEFTQNLVNFINEAHLPYFIVEGVVEKLLSSIKAASVQQLEADKVSYQQQLKEVEEKPTEK